MDRQITSVPMRLVRRTKTLPGTFYLSPFLHVGHIDVAIGPSQRSDAISGGYVG